MSAAASKWALDQNPGRASDKLVLLILADNARAEDGLAFPSIEYVVKHTCLNRKTVIESLRRLSGIGMVTDTGARVGKTRQVIVYRLELSRAAEQSQKRNGSDFSKESLKRNSSEIGTVPFFPSNSTVFSGEQSQKRDTEPEAEARAKAKAKAKAQPPTKKPPAATEPIPDPPDWIDRQAWDGFVGMRKRRRCPLTAYAARLIFAELEKLRAKGHDPTAVLDQSTRQGWRDVYPIRTEGSNDANRQSSIRRSVSGRIEDNIRQRLAREAAEAATLLPTVAG